MFSTPFINNYFLLLWPFTMLYSYINCLFSILLDLTSWLAVYLTHICILLYILLQQISATIIQICRRKLTFFCVCLTFRNECIHSRPFNVALICYCNRVLFKILRKPLNIMSTNHYKNYVCFLFRYLTPSTWK